MNMSEDHKMPEAVKDIAKKLAETARNLGLHSLSGQFEPDRDVWGATVSFNWKEGRHGDESNLIQIQSTFYIHDHVTERKS